MIFLLHPHQGFRLVHFFCQWSHISHDDQGKKLFKFLPPFSTFSPFSGSLTSPAQLICILEYYSRHYLLTVRNPGRALRSTNQLLLEVSRSKYKHWGDRAFSVAAPRLWNIVFYCFYCYFIVFYLFFSAVKHFGTPKWVVVKGCRNKVHLHDILH